MEIMTREVPEEPPQGGIPEGGSPVAETPPAGTPFGAGITGAGRDDADGAEPPADLRPAPRAGKGGRARAAGLSGLVRDALAAGPRGASQAPGLLPVLTEALSCLEGPRTPGSASEALAGAMGDRVLTGSPLYARRPHWTEDPARVLADLAVAATAGRALALLPAPLDGWYGPALEVLAEAEGLELTAREDAHLDGLRALAGVREVALDAGVPDAQITGLAASLGSMRQEAEATIDDQGPSDEGWFGEGVVESPPAPIRVGPQSATTVLVGLGPDDAGELDGEVHLVDTGNGRPEALGRAARETARLAFGREVMGGHSAAAAPRALVRPTVFSAFTEALLEALDEGFASGELGAPDWASERPHRLTRASDLAVELARKVGIEEGATLVFERKRPGDRALVFTNVEARMALAGRLRAPCLLALQRAGATI